MSRREINTDEPRQRTCTVCGLTARNKDELDDHVYHAHRQDNTKNPTGEPSAEQKIDPFFDA